MCRSFRVKRYFDVHESPFQSITRESSHIRKSYKIGDQSNKNKTGSAIDFWIMFPDDDRYLFVRDFKRSRTKPIFLCYMNYTSTQGSYQAHWSKDKQMIAVFDESAQRFNPGSDEWVVGYDWKRGHILHPKEIVQAFTEHEGIGSNFDSRNFHIPNSRELKQFGPERLNRETRIP